MNKKRYTAPSMSTITVNTTRLICSSLMKVKGGGAANDIKWGGSGSSNDIEVNSRRGRFWDEE